jgi:hypothetical protein
VLAENVYNMDETGVMLSMQGSAKVLVRKSDLRKYRGARVKREVVTAIECISADGRYLNPMIIWPAATHRSNWSTLKTPGWHYALQESGYTDSYISLQWLKLIFDPETRERANQAGVVKPRVLICDGFGTHETVEVLEFCLANNIVMCRLPSHTSHKLQPCDVSTFAPLKAAYREKAERLDRGNVNKVGKEHFTALYSPARIRAFTPKNIKAGFAACGLYPFNPDRVLNTMTKPTELTTSEADEEGVGSCQSVQQAQPQDTELQSPTTPVSAEGIASLQDLIAQQNTHNCNEASQWRVQRLIHKLVKAAQMSLAKRILQQHHIRFLMAINNEAKVRRSTRPVVLGTAKVMSYEDLEEARVKRAEKDAAKEAKGKGKRGRKRKTAPEVDALETHPTEVKAKRARNVRSNLGPELEIRTAGSGVPVAKMY